ncbi:hypothetical protein LHP98_06280 [Rhodobacter sp. Har01]|uniref:DUF6782 family putative metallopeptidase n=1 Tax=Rhodobacter sp. Har01 TaxID=2883999 RepID=UPI001D094838|nr:DUF6782 family putative metallopeptidase [Rhodobacter sp. Har01]MCB6177736.1 hypothetical protein [Rhodobacter sp. Har01]
MTAARPGKRPGVALALALLGAAPAAWADQICLEAPYADGTGEIGALAKRTVQALAAYPSLSQALQDQAPRLCLDDTLVEEQAYFEPKTRRIVVRAGLDPDFQLAVIVHEVRHLEQFGRDVCPTIRMTLTDYVRTRQALEADAAAIGLYIAWDLRAGGEAGPWNTLLTWPTHDDLAARFAAEMAASGDVVKATSATYAAWFDDPERREIYAFVSCVNYLDALDREKLQPGQSEVPDDFAETLCRMPDGRPYDCFLPP